MAGAADDNVIVNLYAQLGGGVDDLARHVDVGDGRGGVDRGVFVYLNDGWSSKRQGALHHFAGVDGRVVHGALLLHLVGHQLVFPVKKENAELLLVLERHGGAAILEDQSP